MITGTVVDAEAAVKTWVNLQADLVGVGKPLQKGAHLNRLTGAASVPYAWLTRVGGGEAFGVENPDDRARISAGIYARTKEDAARAATAYANTMAWLARTGPQLVTVSGVPIRLLTTDNLTGPLWLPDLDEPRYVVDVDVYLQG